MNKIYALITVMMLGALQAELSFAQELETISLSKKTVLYKGVNQEVSNWYLYMDKDRIWYMAPLVGISEKPEDWFEKRKDSQNLYKGTVENGTYPTLTLTKDTEPEATLQFYLKKEGNNQLILTAVSDGIIYVFEQK